MKRNNKIADSERVNLLNRVHELFGKVPHEAYFIESETHKDTLMVEWEGWRSAPYIRGRLDEMFRLLPVRVEVRRVMNERQMQEVSCMKEHTFVSSLLHCALNGTYETGQYIKFVSPKYCIKS